MPSCGANKWYIRRSMKFWRQMYAQLSVHVVHMVQFDICGRVLTSGAEKMKASPWHEKTKTLQNLQQKNGKSLLCVFCTCGYTYMYMYGYVTVRSTNVHIQPYCLFQNGNTWYGGKKRTQCQQFCVTTSQTVIRSQWAKHMLYVSWEKNTQGV